MLNKTVHIFKLTHIYHGHSDKCEEVVLGGLPTNVDNRINQLFNIPK